MPAARIGLSSQQLQLSVQRDNHSATKAHVEIFTLLTEKLTSFTLALCGFIGFCLVVGVAMVIRFFPCLHYCQMEVIGSTLASWISVKKEWISWLLQKQNYENSYNLEKLMLFSKLIVLFHWVVVLIDLIDVKRS